MFIAFTKAVVVWSSSLSFFFALQFFFRRGLAGGRTCRRSCVRHFWLLCHACKHIAHRLFRSIIGFLAKSECRRHFRILLGIFEEFVNELLILGLLSHNLFNFGCASNWILLLGGYGLFFF